MKKNIKNNNLLDKFYGCLTNFFPEVNQHKMEPISVVCNADFLISTCEKSGKIISGGKLSEDEFILSDVNDDEALGRIFFDFKGMDREDVFFVQNSFSWPPVECCFGDLKNEFEKLPMLVFSGGDFAMLWKGKKILSIFHHAGHFVHIAAQPNCPK